MRQFVITPDSPFAQLCAGDVASAAYRGASFIMPVGVEMSEKDIPGWFRRIPTQDGMAVYCSAVHEFATPGKGCMNPNKWASQYAEKFHKENASEDHPF